jgi:hypothetical protein
VALLSRVAAQEVRVEFTLTAAPEVVLNATHAFVVIDQQPHWLSLEIRLFQFIRSSYLYAKSRPQITAMSSMNSANNRRWILVKLF